MKDDYTADISEPDRAWTHRFSHERSECSFLSLLLLMLLSILLLRDLKVRDLQLKSRYAALCYVPNFIGILSNGPVAAEFSTPSCA